ncbi:MAG: hypothetical protein AB4290_13755 [Spirulina sp.]
MSSRKDAIAIGLCIYRDRILSVFSVIGKPDRILRFVKRSITPIAEKTRDDEIVDKKNPKRIMFNHVELLPGAISEIVASVADTGVLTLGDRYGLMAATLKEDLDEDERLTVDRILRSVKRGKISLSSQ